MHVIIPSLVMQLLVVHVLLFLLVYGDKIHEFLYLLQKDRYVFVPQMKLYVSKISTPFELIVNVVLFFANLPSVIGFWYPAPSHMSARRFHLTSLDSEGTCKIQVLFKYKM